uniref:FBA_2 domain-containing protein n=1 Tax=Caenorhabditis tropicalis TaxID=1561998 RepID=A0A1I7U6C2_9PELO
MADDYQREADRSAQHLRNSENIRISELTKQERRLQPSIIVESNDEKREKEYLEKKEKLIQKVREQRVLEEKNQCLLEIINALFFESGQMARTNIL